MNGQIGGAVGSPTRLAAVRATGLLDTAKDEDFDRLASLAATLLNAPYAFVTLVDDTRSFWKACIGIDSDDLSERQNAVGDSFCQYVVGSREALIVGDTRLNRLTADNPSIKSMGVLAWAGFPVFSTDGEVLGSFCVVDTQTRDWTTRDVEVLSVLSRAVASEFALRVLLAAAQAAEQTSHALAVTLQASLLPSVPPAVPGLDVAARYRPAGNGQQLIGDFYDVFRLKGKANWAVTMGDVSGKGVEAAKVTSLARHTIRAAGMLGGSPSGVLDALNSALLAEPTSDVDEPRFLTATYGLVRLNPQGGFVLRLASAGHCPSMIRRADGSVEVLELAGLPLGWFEQPKLEERRYVVRPGDALVLYTDGVIEARNNGELFSDSRLVRAISSAPGGVDAHGLAAAIETAVLEFAGEVSEDDMAILVVNVPMHVGGPRPAR